MSQFYQNIIRPLLFRFDPETVHLLATSWANNPIVSKIGSSPVPLSQEISSRLTQTFGDLQFTHPIGLAAGFDKNGVLGNFNVAMGFSFREIGSVTANPSPGNPRPRLFRLPADHSLINRMGLNNDGADIIAERLSQTNSQPGVNIAKTPDPDIYEDTAVNDYIYSYKKLEPHAQYITLNISCPNTEDGKSFEEPDSLKNLLSAISSEREQDSPPLFVKFSADLDEHQVAELLQVTEDYDIDGYVCCNTSKDRSLLNTSKTRLNDIGSGGISGNPLHFRSCRMLHFIRNEVPGEKILIGAGGIDGFQRAATTLACGADLLQIYTGLIYEGPQLVNNILLHFGHLMEIENLRNINELRDYLQL